MNKSMDHISTVFLAEEIAKFLCPLLEPKLLIAADNKMQWRTIKSISFLAQDFKNGNLQQICETLAASVPADSATWTLTNLGYGYTHTISKGKVSFRTCWMYNIGIDAYQGGISIGLMQEGSK